MGRVYRLFDKYSIADIIFGIILGFYIGVYHDSPNLWIESIQIVLLFSIIITLIPTLSAIYTKYKYSEKIPVSELIEALILNIAMTAVSFSFGFIIGSIFIGNYIPDNGILW